jgi:sRNA-binding protein
VKGYREARKWLTQTYPKLFKFGVYRPLAIGIRSQIMEAAPLGMRRHIHLALYRYTHDDLYLLEMRRSNAMRFGLDGVPVEPVDVEHRAYARMVQTERNKKRPPPKRRP